MKRNVLVLLGYAAVSFGYFGWRLLPHPGRAFMGTSQDPLIFMWSFAWWPHAIGSWTNPFVTHVLYAPQGVNLAWATSVPTLSIAFAPLTLLFGPVVSYNIAALLLPALAAWTAYLLCLHLTRSVWPSLVGGYLFGFSSYVMGQQFEGHLNLTGVFLLPLVALTIVRYVQGGLDRRGLAWRLGLLLALQLGISTEIALTMTLVLAGGLVLAYVLARDARPRLLSAAAPVAAGYGIAGVLASPLLAFAVIGFPGKSFTGAELSGTDLMNVLLPTHLNALGGSMFNSVNDNFNNVESALYLGPPTLLIVALYAWRTRRSAATRFLVAGLALSILVALGVALRVDGTRVSALPWALSRHVPGLVNVRFPRFGTYVALAAAVIVALWTATTRGRVYQRPYLLPVLAVAALVPAVAHAGYSSRAARVPFFTDGSYKSCIARNATVVVFPFGIQGDSMLWQAESGFRFRLAEGYISPIVRGRKPLFAFDADPIVSALNLESSEYVPTMDTLLAFAGTHGVDRVLSVQANGYPNEREMRSFGRVQLLGGMLVAPACGQPSLTTRDLSSYVEQSAHEFEAEKTTAYCLGTDYYALPSGFRPTGILEGAKPALYVSGKGLGCVVPPGYTRQGFAADTLGVPANTYPYYAP